MLSAYRTAHSKGSALLKVQNDVLRQLDNRHGVVLVVLDLSAAFDTIDHSNLFELLENRFGVRGSALQRIKP